MVNGDDFHQPGHGCLREDSSPKRLTIYNNRLRTVLEAIKEGLLSQMGSGRGFVQGCREHRREEVFRIRGRLKTKETKFGLINVGATPRRIQLLIIVT